MIVNNLVLHNFRIFEYKRLKLNSKTVIIGPNGSGKTTIILAIASLLGFDLLPLARLVQYSALHAAVKGTVNINNIPMEYKRVIERGEKGFYTQLLVNNVRTAKSSINPPLAVLHFEPRTMSIFYDMSYKRRFWLMLIKTMCPNIASLWARYKAVIRSRNKLIKDKAIDNIDFWDSKLSSLAYAIFDIIRKYVNKLQTLVPYQLKLLPQFEAEEDIKDMLKKSLSRDLSIGYTTVGIHKFNIRCKQGNADLDVFGSRGEQKKALISIILAAGKAYYKKHNEYPILLLDDLFSEFDVSNVSNLLNMLPKDQQCILTAVNDSFLSQIKDMDLVDLSNV